MQIKFGITGHTGSLGRAIIKSTKNIKYIYFKDDIRNKKKVIKWINNNNFQALIHLAAIVPIKVVNKNKKKAYQVNYEGTKNIIDAIKNTNIKWFFFASTSHIYKSNKKKINEKSIIQPISYYGKTKFFAEKYIIKKLKNSNINYCIGRIFSTTNKTQKENYLVPDLKKKIKRTKKKIILKNLNHYRDFISMEEISKIIHYLYKKNFRGIINIGTGKAINLKSIAKKICEKYNKKFNFVDNKKSTYLVADVSKLKLIYKFKLVRNIENLIF